MGPYSSPVSASLFLQLFEVDGSGSQVASEQSAVVFEKTVEYELTYSGNWRVSKNTERGATHQMRRDRQTQLIDQTGLSELPIPCRTALGQYDGGVATVEFIDHRPWRRAVGCKMDKLRHISKCRHSISRRRSAGDDQRWLIAGPLIGEHRQARIQVDRGSHHGQPRCSGSAGGKAYLDDVGGGPRHSVAFRSRCPCGHQNPIAAGSDSAECLRIADSTETAAAPVDGDAAINTRHHVEHHPGSIRGRRPRIVGVCAQWVDIHKRGRQKLAHRGNATAPRSPGGERLWIDTTKSTNNPHPFPFRSTPWVSSVKGVVEDGFSGWWWRSVSVSESNQSLGGPAPGGAGKLHEVLPSDPGDPPSATASISSTTSSDKLTHFLPRVAE